MERVEFAGGWALAAVTALSLLAACGQESGGVAIPSATTTSDVASGSTTTTSAAAPKEVKAACPLVDIELVKANFDVANPQLVEREPVKTGPVTTYACDVSDAGEPFLTAGVSVGPRSGTAEANLRAALSGQEGEPVDDLGEIGGYAEKDGVGTAAGVIQTDDQLMVVFVHGAAGNKEQLVAVAQGVAERV
jgi:hypothetical protein